jgi:predicted nucleotidyltransferase
MEFKELKTEKLAEATAVAEEFASKFRRKGVVGIVFLGGIARGYFDEFSDIDIIIFKKKGTRLGMRREDEIEYKGFKIDYEIANYEDSVRSEWEMEKRWAFSNSKIFYDPEGKIRTLIGRKVHPRNEERKWMIIEGMTQSEWYCNENSESWVYRNDMISAHRSMSLALEYLMKALFGLNNQLLPDEKWLMYQVQRLSFVPERFNEKLKEIILVKDLSRRELQRRRNALNYLWKQMLPRAEKEVGMKFDEFKRLV